MCSRRNDFLDTFLVDDKVAVLVHEISDVLHAEVDNALQGVNGDIPALGILIRRIMKRLVHFLNGVNGLRLVLDHRLKEILDFLTSIFDFRLEVGKIIRAILIRLIQIFERLYVLFGALAEIVRRLLQRVKITRAVRNKVVDVFHVLHKELVLFCVILNRKSHVAQFLCTGCKRFLALIIQIDKRILLTLVCSNEHLLHEQLLFEIV